MLLVGFSSVAGPTVRGLSVSVQQENVLRVLAQEPGIQVVLYSLAGRKIAEGQSSGNQLSLALPSQLANGVYLYVITVNQDGKPRRVLGKIAVLRGRASVGGIKGGSGGQSQPSKAGPISHSFTQAQIEATLAYWTPERMAKAKPYPLPTLPGEPKRGNDGIEKLAQGAPGLFEGELPTVLREGETLEEVIGPSMHPLYEYYPYPGPFMRWQMPYSVYTAYPARAIGKLFFTQYGVDYVCSASVVQSANTVRRLVWTAGHCVHEGDGSPNGWSYNVLFAPAYRDGNAPLGYWPVAVLWTRSEWYYYGNFAYDMGAIVTLKSGCSGYYCSGNTYRIGNVTGMLGWAYNLSYVKEWANVGYPAGSPFTGNRQWVCTSSISYKDESFSPATIGKGCDQTGGTSGGPWITQITPPSGSSTYFTIFGCTACYVNGINSYKYVGFPDELYSPYCGGACYSLWDAARQSDP